MSDEKKVELICPFCGGAVIAEAGEECVVLHSIPTCAKYRDLDALAFITEVRKKLENTHLRLM